MPDNYNPALRGQTAAAGVIDQGLRAYMLRVYNYMLVGLGLTGVSAWIVATVPAVRDMFFVATERGVSLSLLGWVALLAPIGFVMFLSFRINRMSLGAAQATFWGYAALMGVSLAPVLLLYTGASVAQTFFITAATFGAMSLYGYTTKRDLSGFGSFLFMGLIGLIIASVVNIFLASSMMQWVISVAGVLIFTGLTAYDTQWIKEMYVANDDGTVSGRKAIMGALKLYLDFINLFMMLMRLMGDRR
ncbi:MAG TPA: Bax inhibitor-1/YccA family protein [Rhizomicrobium sp.]|jgi:FtsH-binding integral membrane protein|nr:Bax inhibitor-1/YccA family protein [Rhizomicrobium sp.]